jgi:hypothetical protein
VRAGTEGRILAVDLKRQLAVEVDDRLVEAASSAGLFASSDATRMRVPKNSNTSGRSFRADASSSSSWRGATVPGRVRDDLHLDALGENVDRRRRQVIACRS